MEQPVEKYYTFADFLTWDEAERIELVYGEAYMMSPPLEYHQSILMELAFQIREFLKDKSCKIFPAPYGVFPLAKSTDAPEDIDTMVEPDITVICDKSKRDKYGCKGAPDMIIEILSPSSRQLDRVTKFNLYERAGVREYWIADPKSQTIDDYVLDESGRFKPLHSYSAEDIAEIAILPGCKIDLNKVFAEN